MSQKNEEYLMLREEVLQLESNINNTLNFLYAFIASFLAFALGQEDTLYILLSYIAVIPAYIIIVNKLEGMSRIGAYLKVYHEGEEFNWETRNLKLKEKRGRSNFTYIISSFAPFWTINISIFVVFMFRTKWHLTSFSYEECKIVVAVVLFVLLTILLLKNRNISTKECLSNWNDID